LHEHLEQLHASDAPNALPPDGVAIQDKLGLVEIVWQASRILAAQIASARLRDDPAGFSVPNPGRRCRSIRIPPDRG